MEGGLFIIRRRIIILKALLILILGVFIYFACVNVIVVINIAGVDNSIKALLPDTSKEEKALITEIFRLEAEISEYADDVKKIIKIESEEQEKEGLESELKILKDKKESMEALLT